MYLAHLVTYSFTFDLYMNIHKITIAACYTVATPFPLYRGFQFRLKIRAVCVMTSEDLNNLLRALCYLIQCHQNRIEEHPIQPT